MSDGPKPNPWMAQRVLQSQKLTIMGKHTWVEGEAVVEVKATVEEEAVVS